LDSNKRRRCCAFLSTTKNFCIGIKNRLLSRFAYS
jgi:hypothetical protein